MTSINVYLMIEKHGLWLLMKREPIICCRETEFYWENVKTFRQTWGFHLNLPEFNEKAAGI
jgi:hypothetical protein